MASNLPPTQKENWAPNEVVKPEHTNSWGSAINKLTTAMPLYASNGNYYEVQSFSDNIINLVPITYDDGTQNQVIQSYVDGMHVNFKSTFNNTEQCLVNIDNLGAKQIKTLTNENLIANSISSGYFVELIYNKENDIFYLLESKPANTDLSNLTTAGEKHFLNMSQITNCLLEVPQRIKYTLENGTLTIKAGSVVIVPYGTEDKTADLPKGATFINENFKVYDTQFSDGKFFVWAELQVDNVMTDWGTVTDNNILCLLATNSNVSNMWKYSYSGDTAPTLAPETDGFALWYDTKNNLVKATINNGSTWTVGNSCFPYVLASFSNGKVSTIDQVFNGMGYIGSTVWVDKGVKGLISNGRNADGSLINEEIVTDKLVMQTIGNFTEPSARLSYLPVKLWDSHLDYVPKSVIYEQNAKPQITDFTYRWYDTINNKWYVFDIVESIAQYAQFLELADMSYTNGKITSFAPKLPFRAADYNDIDGRWVSQSVEIINGDTVFPLGSKQYRDYDISNYLPNDGHIYELAVEIIAFSGSSTNAVSHWWISDILGTYGAYQTCSCGGKAYSNSRDEQYANGRIPMAGRTLRLWCSSTGTAPTIRLLKLSGYRKVR